MTTEMLAIRRDNDIIHVGDRFRLTLQRALRIPDDGFVYAPPPGFGPFPTHPVAAFGSRTPETWQTGGYFIPMYQREALWLQFEAAHWKRTR